MSTPTDKIRAALEDAYHISVIAADRRKFTEALSELDGCVLIDFALLSEACSSALHAREGCRGNEYWYKTYGDTLKKLEDAAAPYVNGEKK